MYLCQWKLNDESEAKVTLKGHWKQFQNCFYLFILSSNCFTLVNWEDISEALCQPSQSSSPKSKYLQKNVFDSIVTAGSTFLIECVYRNISSHQKMITMLPRTFQTLKLRMREKGSFLALAWFKAHAKLKGACLDFLWLQGEVISACPV